jgi:hypothetical protein
MVGPPVFHGAVWLSLTQAAFTVGGSGGTWLGWSVLIFGALGLFSGKPANLLWLCNPVLASAWLVARTNFRHASALAVLASRALRCFSSALLSRCTAHIGIS